MNLLIFTWKHEFMLRDIVEVFKEWNYSLSFFEFDIYKKDKSNNPDLLKAAIEYLDQKSYDAVFSINYFPDIARACHEKNITYISWTYDCPLDLENIEETLIYPTNRAFFFDKKQCDDFVKEGITTAFHMPLGINSKRLSQFCSSSKYECDISFVGNIYHSSYPTLCKYMSDYYQGYTKGMISAQKNTYGAYLVKEAISDSFLEQINEDLQKHQCPYAIDGKHVSKNQLAYSLATEATFENRLLYLGLLSNNHKLNWYTSKDSSVLSNINKCDPVDYYTEMPVVFKSSKINLHIGLHAIPSGISLRQLDILGCKGFLLSSFQPELFDYFVPGEDFDYYTCPEEAYEKADFYLNNENIRAKVAQNGFEKASQLFDYHIVLKSLIKDALG